MSLILIDIVLLLFIRGQYLIDLIWMIFILIIMVSSLFSFWLLISVQRRRVYQSSEFCYKSGEVKRSILKLLNKLEALQTSLTLNG